jgi:1-phosphatidylinositol phosphodiesterase
MFSGQFLIANCRYNYLFAADKDKKDSDHVVETRPSSCTTLASAEDKFKWELIDAGNGCYRIKNVKYGYIFAADKDTIDGDHMVEARPGASNSDLEQDKFKWRIVREGNLYAISNVKHGAIFAAVNDTSDGDHLVEARRSPSASDKQAAKFKWMIFNEYNLNNWMSRLDSHKSLEQISLPGTHDSCALYGGFAAETQTRSLMNQMNAGVRFLDIRCRHSESHFSIFHGSVYQEIGFQKVLDQCYEFLRANPSETLVMSVKKEGDGERPIGTFQQQFEAYIANTKNFWFLENRFPKLSEVKGKIVLLRRFNKDSSSGELGLDAKSDWKDDATFAMNLYSPLDTMEVQDQYSTNNAEKKWNWIRSLLDRAKSDCPERLFLNFSSATDTKGVDFIPNPEKMANQINPKLIEYFVANRGRFGIIAMDFNLANISGIIVQTNL